LRILTDFMASVQLITEAKAHLLPRSLKTQGQKPDVGGMFENLKVDAAFMASVQLITKAKSPFIASVLKDPRPKAIFENLKVDVALYASVQL